jgi:hypothetical protein
MHWLFVRARVALALFAGGWKGPHFVMWCLSEDGRLGSELLTMMSTGASKQSTQILIHLMEFLEYSSTANLLIYLHLST